MRPHASAELGCATGVAHECGKVVPHDLADVLGCRPVVACECLLHEGDVAGQWLVGAAVAEGVVGLGQDAVEGDGLQQCGFAYGGGVEGEVAAEADGTGRLSRVAEPPVEDHAGCRGPFQFVKNLLAGGVAVDAGDARGAGEDVEDPAEGGLLAVHRDAALAVEPDLADQGGAVDQLGEGVGVEAGVAAGESGMDTDSPDDPLVVPLYGSGGLGQRAGGSEDDGLLCSRRRVRMGAGRPEGRSFTLLADDGGTYLAIDGGPPTGGALLGGCRRRIGEPREPLHSTRL